MCSRTDRSVGSGKDALEDGQTRWRTDIGVGGQTGAGEQIHADGQALQDGHRYFRMVTGAGGRTQALEVGNGH